MKIGMFDSGIGGITLLNAAMRALPNVEFIYYADTDNVPYGEKTLEQINSYAQKASNFLISKGARAIVVACNTATSASILTLRNIYENCENIKRIPIIGMEPAIKLALDVCQEGRILVAATPVTVRGRKLFDLMEKYDKDKRVDLLSLPKLVSFAENDDFDSNNVYKYLHDSLCNFNISEYSAFVLGCTHFNFFKKAISSYLPSNIKILDGVDGTVNRLISRLSKECGDYFIENNENPCKNIKDAFKTEFYISSRKASQDEIIRFNKLIELAETARKI